MARARTSKVYQERINLAWTYIQNNLHRRISLEELASIACISPYHFHRIFTAYTGEPLDQYSKRLRLEKAANLLQKNATDITNIASRCGYDSPSAFSKAFKQHYQMSPSEFRHSQHAYIAQYRYPTQDDKELQVEHKIIRRPGTRVLYIRKTGDYMQSAPQAWQAMDSYAEQHQLYNEHTEMIGICHDSPELTDKEKIRYDACIPVADNVQADGEFAIQQLYGGDYAVFTHLGPYEELIDTYHRIECEWLANQERELADAPAFEIYINPELMESDPQALKTDIYFPLK